MKLKLLDLFSGIGGFSLGLESTGFFETIGFVEKDKFCQKVLKKHWNNINIEEDIRNVKGERYAADIITGGFPCQDLSVAGKRAGLAGERSGLFWEIARIVEETQSEYAILENVPGLLSSNNGADFAVVLGTMADLGYSVAWRVLDAQYFGVPQRRKRVFIACRRASSGSAGEILFKQQGVRRDSSTLQQKRENITRGIA